MQAVQPKDAAGDAVKFPMISDLSKASFLHRLIVGCFAASETLGSLPPDAGEARSTMRLFETRPWLCELYL